MQEGFFSGVNLAIYYTNCIIFGIFEYRSTTYEFEA